MRRRVLLTGASGLLGGELAGRLIDAGHEVTGVVNRTPAVTRNDGRPVALTAWSGGAGEPATLRTIVGDIAHPRLGWDDATWGAVAESHDLLVHAAALTRFDALEAQYRAVNVNGTSHVIALARAGAMGMLQVSTAYVCGERDGVILERELNCGQRFANGYEASKAAAERLVHASGLTTVIARPSIIVGDHTAGRIRRFDTFYVVLKLLAEGRISTMPASAGASLDLVPIDYVADGITALVEQFDLAAGGAIHLVADRPTPVEAFPQTLARHAGLAAPRLVEPAKFDLAVLAPAERRFFERGASLYAGYFARSPRFDDTQARALTKLAPPPVDQDWWDRLVSYAIGAGFVRTRGAGAARGSGDQASRSRPRPNMLAPRIVVFVRFPTAGHAKTRLIPAIGAERAANVHRRLAERTIAAVRASKLPFELHTTGAPSTAFVEWLGPATVIDQREGNLGERLAAAGPPYPTLFIGSDAPDLTPGLLTAAADALVHAPAVIGPAEDGGYWLLGLRERCDAVFVDMPWSTDRVCLETEARLEAAGTPPAWLPTLADCDRPEDLARWPDLCA